MHDIHICIYQYRAVEPIQQISSKEEQERRIYTCWQSLFEAVMHETYTCYTEDVDAQPYYQATKYTNMRINDAIGVILGFIHPKYDIAIDDNVTPGILGAFDLEEATLALKNINTQGYHIMSTKLNAAALKTMALELTTLNYNNHPTFDKTLRDGSVNFVKDQRETLQKVSASFDLMLGKQVFSLKIVFTSHLYKLVKHNVYITKFEILITHTNIYFLVQFEILFTRI